MISWIQITFEKHTKAFIAFLLIAITIPFVFTIGASPGIGGGRRVRQKEFFGHNIGNPGVERQIRVDAQISVLLKMGFMVPADNPRLQFLANDRVAALALADQHRIAAPTKADLATFIGTFPVFQNDGKFDPKRYADFADQLKTNSTFSVADVARVMAEEYRIKRINELLAGPGFALPAEVAARLTQVRTEWTVKIGTFDLASFAPALNTAADVLAAYFEKNAGRYEIPALASVDYVQFKAADFESNSPLSDNDVVAFFEANKARFAPPSNDPAKPAPTPELAAVRPMVEAAMRQNAAALGAAKAASDFAYALFDKKVAKGAPAIDDLAAKYRGKRAEAPLFSANESPAGLPWPRQIVAEAFRLSDKRYYSDPLPVGADQIVLLWKETKTARPSLLAEVREKVLADFTAEEHARLLNENGQRWKTALAAKLAAGTAFDAALAALPGLPKCETKSPAPFTLAEPPSDLTESIASALDRLQAGEVSDLLVDEKKGCFVQVVARKAPAIDPSSPDYAKVRDSLTGNSSAAARSLVVAELIEAEQKRFEPEQP